MAIQGDSHSGGSPFAVRHVMYHLCSAELWNEAFEVASNVKWLLGRAQLESLGVVLDLELAARAAGSPYQRTIRLMGQALRMNLDELRYDYRSVVSQLVARLMGLEETEEQVRRLLAELRKWGGPQEGWCGQRTHYKSTTNAQVLESHHHESLS